MSEGEDILRDDRRMTEKRKNKSWKILLMSLTAALLVTACGTAEPSSTDTKNEAAVDDYLAPVRAEAETLFSEIAETAAGTRPKEIRIGFRPADADSLKEFKSLPELLADADPVLFVGYIASSDKGFSDDEIHDIIAEIVSRDICVDLYFHYQDDYVYQVRRDGVVIDKATGKDGGALREQIPYEL